MCICLIQSNNNECENSSKKKTKPIILNEPSKKKRENKVNKSQSLRKKKTETDYEILPK